jgi:hypothetical protein
MARNKKCGTGINKGAGGGIVKYDADRYAAVGIVYNVRCAELLREAYYGKQQKEC